MSPKKWIVAAVALGLIGLTAALLLRVKATQRLGKPGLRASAIPGSPRLRIELPERVLDYSSTNIEPIESELKTLPKDTSFGRRLYQAPDGFQVLLSVVMMGTDRTSIHKPEYCLEAQGWRIVRRETATVPLDRPSVYELPMMKFLARLAVGSSSGEAKQHGGVYAFWFVADRRITASHLGRVGWLTYDLLRTGVLPRWAYVSCFATCRPGLEEAAFERMKLFIGAAVPEFQIATPTGKRQGK